MDDNEAGDDGVAVASAGPYTNHLHLTPDRSPCQHLVTQLLQARCSSWRPTNGVKAMKATASENKPDKKWTADNTWLLLITDELQQTTDCRDNTWQISNRPQIHMQSTGQQTPHNVAISRQWWMLSCDCSNSKVHYHKQIACQQQQQDGAVNPIIVLRPFPKFWFTAKWPLFS